MSSWCDLLASTPTIGVTFTPNFISSAKIIDALSPIFSGEFSENRAKFNIENQDSFSLIFNTEAGFRYVCEPSSISVAYNHRAIATASSGGPPILQLISKPAPYSDLLKEVSDRLLNAASLLPHAAGRTIGRVGIVSLTAALLADLPPGIANIFGEIGRPLGGQLDSMSSMISTVLSQTETETDRCLHTLNLPTGKDNLVGIQLDWQRLYLKGLGFTRQSLSTALNQAIVSALSYYDRFAEGGLADVIDGNS